MSKQTYSICFCIKRRFKVLKEGEIPFEINALFKNYSSTNGSMNLDQFHSFLKEVQSEDKLTREEAQTLMINSALNKHHKYFNIQDFFMYLKSHTNSPLQYPPKVHQDMNAPFSHYYIYTGHNSYLTGNQISSDCSHVPIVDALRRGVRVIELDMWPNSTKDDIDIRHGGGAVTSPVELMTCLKAIKDNAFVSSEYPVILTLEDHLTPNLQAKVAEMVSTVFGEILVSSNPEHFAEFPSPESMKGRIILSTKPPKEYRETKNSKEEEEAEVTIQVNQPSEEAAWGKEIPDFLENFKGKENTNDHYEEDDDYYDDKDHSFKPNLAPEYKHLIAIRAEKMKGGIKKWLKVDTKHVHRVSLNEEKLEEAVITHGTDIVRFNQRNLMRVYPKGTRIDSSNYNPLISWIHGSQMVAFNMQGNGRPLWLMQGLFRANGGCGFVKKPDFLLKAGPDNQVFDPKSKLPVKKTLKVKVFIGEGWNLDFRRTHFDLYSPPDFYVKIAIAGVSADLRRYKTKVIEDSWLPVWNEEFDFPLTVPELALLRIEVHEFDMSDKDDFGGQTCLPVSELKTGIRAVPLHDYKGDKYNSVKLLMRFEFI